MRAGTAKNTYLCHTGICHPTLKRKTTCLQPFNSDERLAVVLGLPPQLTETCSRREGRGDVYRRHEALS